MLDKNKKTSALRLLSGFVLLSLSGFFWGSLIGFSFQDPQPSSLGFWLGIEDLANPFGPLGAAVSFFSFSYLGLASFAVPIVTFLLWSSFFKRRNFVDFAQHFGLILLSLELFTGILSLRPWEFQIGGGNFQGGGYLGYGLIYFLKFYLGHLGSVWILLSFCGILFLSLWPSSWTFQKIKNFKLKTKELINFDKKPDFVAFEKEIESFESGFAFEQESVDFTDSEDIELDPEKETVSSPALIKKLRFSGLPPLKFLKRVHQDFVVDEAKLGEDSQILVQKLADFGIAGEIVAVRPGPVITLFEFRPGSGIKVSRISNLSDDLSMALSAQSVRILAPLPGKSVVGIEIPNKDRETVYLREFLEHSEFRHSKHLLPVAIGKDIFGVPYFSDLARMPHLLCAGQTGSGKSVFMNGLICSLFYKFPPSALRMILIDPKFIEFRAFENIPHLLLPVVNDPEQARLALHWAVKEMERRYRILAWSASRHLQAFNDKIDLKGQSIMQTILEQKAQEAGVSEDWKLAFESEPGSSFQIAKLPTIVIVIDELADLMMIARKEVEISIARLSQKARAAGIHLVVATQRPSTDVITGLIKANLPTRLSFQLASGVDSKTILDKVGAEKLLGQGDLLFVPPGASQAIRLHAAYLSDSEIDQITDFLRSQGSPSYRVDILESEDEKQISRQESFALLDP